jgi:hypothetical protein
MVDRLKYLALPALAAAALAFGAGRVVSAAPPARPPVPLAACSAGLAGPVTPSAFAQPGAVRPAGQVRHFPRQNLTFSAGTTAEGDVQLDGRGGEFSFRKKVRDNGRYSLEIEGPNDKVLLKVSDDTISVTRGKKTIELTADATEAQAQDVRRLLADSKAVQLLRSAGAEFDASDEDSAATVAVLLSDALVGALTGDVGAPRRVARRLARHAGVGVRSAGARPVTCYYQWEQSMLWAFMELEECTYFNKIYLGWCLTRWTIQAESSWFSFISCSGLGLGLP